MIRLLPLATVLSLFLITGCGGDGSSSSSTTSDGSSSGTAPTVTDILRYNPTQETTADDTVTFRVTFSEAVVNVTADDFAAGGDLAGTATVNNVTEQQSDTHDVTLGSITDANGSLGLGFASGQDIADSDGNALEDTTPTGSNETYIIDNSGVAAPNNGNSAFVFTAEDSSAGIEPFISDGGSINTQLLHDINGSGDSNAGEYTKLGSNLVLFAAKDANGRALRVYDMDAETFATIDNINSGNGQPTDLTVYNSKVFFAATDADGDTELWSSDGTSGNTVRVANINSGTSSSNPARLTVMGTKLFFVADSGNGRELHSFDGTNVTEVTDINTSGGSDVKQLTEFDSHIYFSATDGGSSLGQELWEYPLDGSNPPSNVTDINGGTGDASPKQATVFNSKLFFSATNGSDGRELYSCDTGDNCSMVKDIHTGGNGKPQGLTVSNDGSTLFFEAKDGSNGESLWSMPAGGTPGLLKNITGDSENGAVQELTAYNSLVLFRANDAGSSGNNIELWKTDGTTAGTVMVKDFSRQFGLWPKNLFVFEGYVYFGGLNYDTSELQLWRSDATASGTVKVKGGFATSSSLWPGKFTIIQ